MFETYKILKYEGGTQPSNGAPDNNFVEEEIKFIIFEMQDFFLT